MATMKFQTIKSGSTGTQVYILQALLRGLQCLGKDGKPLTIDGVYGPNTADAIKTFKQRQKAYGYSIGTIDGTFNSACWKILLGV